MAVAFSGGIDSTFLLKVAAMALPKDKLLAVTACSPTYTQEELKTARNTTKNFGVRHKIIKTYELEDKNFSANPVNRCYFCKKELFGRLKDIAKAEKLNFVVDASNLSDKEDFRPGSVAKEEFRVRSPLQEAGLGKKEIRALSKKIGIKDWDKPAAACLASRIPYGRKISAAILKQVNGAERYLRSLGFPEVRLRYYNGLCRIEVAKGDIPRLIIKRKQIIDKLKKLGYNYITLDLEGYRTGSMNEILDSKDVKDSIRTVILDKRVKYHVLIEGD